MAYPCYEFGKEPLAALVPPFATSLAQCVAIDCRWPLQAPAAASGGANSTVSTCNGCAPGRFGAYPACQPCPPGGDLVCPGFTLVPLLSTTLLRRGGTACPALEGLEAERPAYYASEARLKAPLDSSPFAPTLALALAGVALALAGLPVGARLCPEQCARALRACRRGLRRADAFSPRMTPPAPSASDAAAAASRRAALLRRAAPSPLPNSPCGGAWTLIAYACLCLGVLYYVLSFFALSNVAAATTLALLKDSTRAQLQRSNGTWLATPGSPADALPPFSGLLVRVLAQGDPGKCSAPLPVPLGGGGGGGGSGGGALFVATGLDAAAAASGAGGWRLQLQEAGAPPPPPPPPQAASGLVTLASALNGTAVPHLDAANVSATTCGGTGFHAFQFACPACEISDEVALTFTLHYSCQALVIEVLSAGPGDPTALSGGEVLSLTRPAAALYRVAGDLANTTGSSSAFLSSVRLSAQVVRGVVVDEARDQLAWFFPVAIPGLPLFFSSARFTPIGGRGYIVNSGRTAGAFVSAADMVDYNSTLVAFTPNARSVQVTVALSSSQVLSVTTLTLHTSATALVTSVISLVGLFGFFGGLYAHAVYPLSKRFCRGALAGEEEEEGGGGGGGGGSGGRQRRQRQGP